MALHRRGVAGFHRFLLLFVANIDGQSNPCRENRGTMVVRLILSLLRFEIGFWFVVVAL
jgi:hypothetical protein